MLNINLPEGNIKRLLSSDEEYLLLGDGVDNSILKNMDDVLNEKDELKLKLVSSLEGNSLNVITVSEEDMKSIIDYYNLYEFSNKIKLITESKQFPSLFNYVKTGILTIDEMIDAILYET